MTKTIGILGGIGPESSAVFYKQLIDEFKNRFHPIKNTEFPRIIINSIPAPELTSGDNSNKLQAYIEGLKFIEKESDFIVIICNTAYLYLETFREVINKPIIDINNLINQKLHNLSTKKTLLLASPNSIDLNLFKFKGIDNTELDIQEKKQLGEIINKYNSNEISKKESEWLFSLINKYYKNCDYVLIGCTELSLLLKEWKDIKKIDTFNLFIEETLNKYVSISKN